MLASVLSQSIGSDEGQSALNRRLSARDVWNSELGHEESELSGSHLMGITGMDSVLLCVCAVCSTNTEELKEGGK